MKANNMKEMCEALEIAKKAICHHANHICDSLAWENSTINANCGDILCAYRDLCKAKTAIQRALAKPPRAVMSVDLAAVRSCDAIYLLRGWEDSRGAKMELAEAIKNGLEIMQEGAEK